MKQFILDLFTFKGRIGRGRFVINWLAIFISSALIQAAFMPVLPIVGAFFMFFVLFAFIANMVKRIHDLDQIWALLLLSFIPVVNFILVMILVFVKGTKGPNKYGADPVTK